MAWLQSVPEVKAQGKASPDRRTRQQRLEADGASIMLPEITAGGYLVRHLFEVGPMVSSGMGPGPISYQDIKAWQDVTATSLSPGDGAALRRLSREYVSEYHAAEKPDRPAPWAEGVSSNPYTAARALRDAMRAKAGKSQ